MNGPAREIVDYYTHVPEESRLKAGSSQLEFERTKELIRRFLPLPPAQIVDVGGGSGPYAFWLASLGHSVRLVDATARLLEEARRQNDASPQPLTSIAVGDARRRYFVTAYFHRPEDLVQELVDAGYQDVRVFGVEGPCWLLPDFEARWNDLERRRDLLEVARLLEQETSVMGASAHLLAIGTKPGSPDV
jgi:SAM-dependent methyltransferase